jgi:hypothetical protein
MAKEFLMPGTDLPEAIILNTSSLKEASYFLCVFLVFFPVCWLIPKLNKTNKGREIFGHRRPRRKKRAAENRFGFSQRPSIILCGTL